MQQKLPRKKLEKSLKKYLTNAKCCDTLIKRSKNEPRISPTKRKSKKFWKTFKKVLTNEKSGDIITKLSARAGSERTLKIEQRKTRYVKRHSTKNLTRTIPKREYTMFDYKYWYPRKKVEEQQIKLWKDISSTKYCKIIFLESLILAQDKRWRRA